MNLHSLGVVFWEMVTGHVMFRGSAARGHASASALTVAARTAGKRTPADHRFCLKYSWEKNPARRFQSPAETPGGDATGKGKRLSNAGRRLMKTLPRFRSFDRRRPKREAPGGSKRTRSIAAEFNLPVGTSRWNFQRLAEEDDILKS